MFYKNKGDSTREQIVSSVGLHYTPLWLEIVRWKGIDHKLNIGLFNHRNEPKRV